MRFQENFKFLNVEIMKRKKTKENQEENQEGNQEGNQEESKFLILNLLDNENYPIRFFVFNEDLIEKVLQNQYVGLQDILIDFALIFKDNKWSVRLLDVN